MNRRIPLAGAAVAGGGGMLAAAFLSTAVAVADSGEGSAAELSDNVFTIGDFTFDPGDGPAIDPLFAMPPLLEIGGAGGLYDFVSLIEGDTTVGDLLDDSGIADASLSDLVSDLSLGDLLNGDAELGDLLNDEAALGDLLSDGVTLGQLINDDVDLDYVGDILNDFIDEIPNAHDGKYGFPDDIMDAPINDVLADFLNKAGIGDTEVLSVIDNKGSDGKADDHSKEGLTLEHVVHNMQLDASAEDIAENLGIEPDTPLLQAIGLDDTELSELVDGDAKLSDLLNDDASLGDLINDDASLGELLNPDATIGGLADNLLGSGIEDQAVGDLLGELLPDTGTSMEVYGDGGDTLLGTIDTTQNVSNIFGIESAQFTVTDVLPVGDAGEDDLPAEGTVYSITDLGMGFQNIYEADPTGDGGADITDTFITPFGDIDLSTEFNAVAQLMPADIWAGTDTDAGGDLFGNLFSGLGGSGEAESAAGVGDVAGGDEVFGADLFGGLGGNLFG